MAQQPFRSQTTLSSVDGRAAFLPLVHEFLGYKMEENYNHLVIITVFIFYWETKMYYNRSLSITKVNYINQDSDLHCEIE
jgi:hypothetical protein